MTQIKFSELLESLEITQGEAQDVRSAPERVNNVLNSILAPGRSVVLSGDPGNGKERLAQEVANLLRTRIERDIEILLLPQPSSLTSRNTYVFASAFPELIQVDLTVNNMDHLTRTHADLFIKRLQQTVDEISAYKDVVVIAPGIDQYGPFSERLLHYLVQTNKVRVVATAQRLSGAADRITQDPHVDVHAIGPLSEVEAHDFLAQLLKVEQIDQCTLLRWCRESGGNAYFISALALASDRAGVLHRKRGTAWVNPGDEVVPEEVHDFLDNELSGAELHVLDLIAITEPVVETCLLQKLDPDALTTLHERGLIVSRPMPFGGVALTLAHPILTATISTQMSVARRLQLNEEIYLSLREEHQNVSAHRMPDRLLRLVLSGLNTNHFVPVEWLSIAFEMTMLSGNLQLTLRLALALASHPQASLSQRCDAALHSRRLARLVGDKANLHHAIRLIREVLNDGREELSAAQSIHLRVGLIEEQLWAGELEQKIIEQFEVLEREIEINNPALREYLRGSKTLALASMGLLKESLVCAEVDVHSTSFAESSARAPALLIASYVLQQQGHIDESIQLSERGRTFALLGELPLTDLADVQGFAVLLGHWAAGDSVTGYEVLEEFSQKSPSGVTANTHFSGLSATATILFALNDGRWAKAAQISESLISRLPQHDSYGIESFVQVTFALALAALGDRTSAVQALKATRTPQRGMSQGLGGYLRILRLRTKHWLHSVDTLAEAREVARWAQEQNLALIELLALHVASCVTNSVDTETLQRVQWLAARLNMSVSDAVTAHLIKISAQDPMVSHADIPEVRMLAEFGIWLPLPPAENLTSREREVAVLAAHGYSNRQIAEHLHISVRTVETHMGNVITKLEVESRDGLRKWFVIERAQRRPQ